MSGVGFAVMTEVAKAALQRVARVWPAALVVGVLALDLAFGSLLGASSPASATSGYAYDVPIHAYDGGAHSVAMHVESASPVAPDVASLATQETVVQATAALSVLLRLSVAANSGLTSDLEALATRNVTNSGQTVLGSHPTYIEAAQARGASYFDIGDAWNGLSPAQRTATNNFFLDSRMAAGDQFYLTTPKGLINPSSQLAQEVAYITRPGSGYQWVNQWSLKPGG